MSDDIANEIENIFANNTVDQVVVICSKTKKDIGETQEKLRELVGSRYRELLGACDKVVGMDAICESIKTRSEKIRSGDNITMNGVASPSSTRADSAPRPDENQMDEQRLNDAILAADLSARLHSIHVLSGQDHLFDAAARYRTIKRVLHDVEGTINDSLFQPVRASAALVPNKLMASVLMCVEDTLTKEHTMRPVALERYNDIHAAIEQLYGCTSSVAVEKLISVHIDVISRISERGCTQGGAAVPDAITKVISALCNCLYFLHHCKTISGGTQATRMSVDELTSLDPNEPGYLDKISLQVLGLGALHETPASNSKDVMDGWALSPATAPPASDIDRKLVDKLQKCAQEHFSKLVEHVADVATVVLLEEHIGALIENLHQIVGASVFSHQELVLHVHAALSSRVLSHIRASMENTEEACGTVCEDLSRKELTGTSDAISAPSSSAKPAARISQLIRRRFQTSNSSTSAPIQRSADSSDLSALDYQLAVAASNLKEAIERARSRGGSEAALATREVLDAATKAFTKLLGSLQQRVAKSRANDETRVLYQYSRVVTSIARTVTDVIALFSDAQLKGTQLDSISAELEELHGGCHKLWIREVAAEFKADAVRTLKAIDWNIPTSQFSALYASSWVTENVETTSVSVPKSCSPELFQCIVRLQRSIRGYNPSSIRNVITDDLHSSINDAVIGAYESLFNSFPDPAAGDVENICEEAYLQMYFDLRFLVSCYHTTALTPTQANALKRMVKQIENRVDMVNWSVATPIIDQKVSSAVHAVFLSLGLFRSSTTSTKKPAAGLGKLSSGSNSSLATGAMMDVESFKVRLHPEATRISSLPIATPAASSPSALLASKLGPAGEDAPLGTSQSRADDANGSGGNTGIWSSTNMPSLKGIRSAFNWTK